MSTNEIPTCSVDRESKIGNIILNESENKKNI